MHRDDVSLSRFWKYLSWTLAPPCRWISRVFCGRLICFWKLRHVYLISLCNEINEGKQKRKTPIIVLNDDNLHALLRFYLSIMAFVAISVSSYLNGTLWKGLDEQAFALIPTHNCKSFQLQMMIEINWKRNEKQSKLLALLICWLNYENCSRFCCRERKPHFVIDCNYITRLERRRNDSFLIKFFMKLTETHTSDSRNETQYYVKELHCLSSRKSWVMLRSNTFLVLSKTS